MIHPPPVTRFTLKISVFFSAQYSEIPSSIMPPPLSGRLFDTGGARYPTVLSVTTALSLSPGPAESALRGRGGAIPAALPTAVSGAAAVGEML